MPAGSRLSFANHTLEDYGNDEIELSIVMPCLDEAGSIRECIRDAQAGIAELGISAEIIVADNGSTDGSPRIAADLGARVVDVEERGYGSALMGGFEVARGRFVLMGDADATYDFRDLGPFIERLRAGDDLVVGNRFEGGINPGAMPALNRYVGNPVLSFVARRFFGSDIGDFHCGLRAFRRDALPRLQLQSTGMELASEMLVKATLYGLRVSEVPTKLSPGVPSRRPHLQRWRDGWRHLRFLLLYSPRWLFLYPGAALMAAGTLLMALILPGEFWILGVGLDVHTLVYASAAIVVGYQAIIFAVLARLYAMQEGFLPPEPWLTGRLQRARLETGLAVGVLMLTAGLILSVVAVLKWGNVDFGQLDYRSTLRIVVPATTLLMLGVQTLFASFFFSILAMERRRQTTRAEDHRPTTASSPS